MVELINLYNMYKMKIVLYSICRLTSLNIGLKNGKWWKMEICCLNSKKEECGGEEGREIIVTSGQPGKITQLQPKFGVSCDCGGCPVYQIWVFRSCWRENPVIVGEFNDRTI